MHLLSTQQFTSTRELDSIFHQADSLQWEKVAKNKLMAIIMDESSIRMRLSFEVAMKRLKGEVVVLETATSSRQKGESLAATLRTVSEYVDVLVVRSREKLPVEAAQVPLINAGDGAGEHPTQALLDLYTMRQECGRLEGLKVLVVGDLKHSRTVHSLLPLLELYAIQVCYVAPKPLQIPGKFAYEELVVALEREQPDVVYLTRLQAERHEERGFEYPGLGCKELAALGRAVVLHPLPCGTEMGDMRESDPRCAVWRQVQHGLSIRMALLTNLFSYGTFFYK
jgi:aspartate carbamoyltransferase